MIPKADRIIDNLIETFGGISTADGYYTDVTKVENRGDTLAQPAPDELPYIGVYDDGEERSIVFPSGMIRWIYPITVVGHVRGGDRALAREMLGLLIEDIEVALFKDPTRGADPVIEGARNAVKTGAIQTRRRVRAVDGTYAGVELHFEVEYEEERFAA